MPNIEHSRQVAQELLSFWFGPEADWNRATAPPKSCERLWWGGGATLDAEITDKYQSLLIAAASIGEEAKQRGRTEVRERLLAAEANAQRVEIAPLQTIETDEESLAVVRDWSASLFSAEASPSPHCMLALVILQDQFSRNIFRGSPGAFAFDRYTVPIVRQMLDQGDEQHLAPLERFFLYMPLEHSESLQDQELGVKLINELVEAVRQDPALTSTADYLEGVAKNKLERQAIISQFSRYPPRNKQLGRASTPSEEQHLAARMAHREEQEALDPAAAAAIDSSNVIFALPSKGGKATW
jgi:uncharacterized protein (DUF924 family)